MNWLSLFSMFGAVLLVSCVEHNFSVNNYECESDEEVRYQNQIAPLVMANCAISGCHNGDNGADKDWTNFEKFQSNASDVRDRITRPPDAPGHMPAKGSLTREEIETLICWIEQGAKDN